MIHVHVVVLAILLFIGAIEAHANRVIHSPFFSSKLFLHSGGHSSTFPVFPRIARLRGGMNLKVRTLTGKTITVTVDKSDSIELLKSKIAGEAGIPRDQQRLLLSGKQLDDRKTVGDYGELENNSLLHLVLRLRGGLWYR